MVFKEVDMKKISSTIKNIKNKIVNFNYKEYKNKLNYITTKEFCKYGKASIFWKY